MTPQEAQQKTVLSWLKDAHALEVGALPTLKAHLSAAENYPELHGKLQQHLEETQRHAELVEGCIGRLGGKPAALKETVSSAVGKVTGIANLPAKDTVVKNALGDYAAENFEIACYNSLIAGAEALGDQETVAACQQILRDEEEMAIWLAKHIPTLTVQYLAEVVDAPDAQATLDNLKQKAADLGEKGKEAASGIDARNALLASGALLAGAGAALLVGQALRGKSDKDGSDQSGQGEPTMQADAQSAVADRYDGYVTEVEAGSSAPVEASGLPEPTSYGAGQPLEPRPDFDSDMPAAGLVEDVLIEDVLVEDIVDVPVELVYTEVWLTPGPYTGVGPKNRETEDATGQEVYSRLTQHGQVDASLIEVTIDNGEVLLEGTVDSEETRRAAEEAVASISGVTRVQNLLAVRETQTASEGQTGEGDTQAEVQEFEHSTSVNASPDEVYAFMAQVENLPKYLPTTHSAQPQEGERVRVQGEAQGHEYDADGFFRKDEANHRIEWGADEQYYSGWLEVSGQGEGSTMTVHLTFSGGPPAGEGDAPGDDSGGSEGPNRAQIQEGLVKALTSIKNFVEEGRSGGKEEPGAAT